MIVIKKPLPSLRQIISVLRSQKFLRAKAFVAVVMLFIFSAVTSCDILQQVEGMRTLSKCEFRIHTLTDIRLAEVDISGIRQVSDIRAMDVLQLTNAFINNQLPLDFTVNLQVKNPNDQPALLNRLEWQLFVDNTRLLDGVVNERFETPAGETGTLPLRLSINLAEVLSGENINKALDYAVNLADGQGATTRVMLRLKPSVMVSGQSIIYPGWIDVENEFTAN
jgi:LEA14-like dessication related protein